MNKFSGKKVTPENKNIHRVINVRKMETVKQLSTCQCHFFNYAVLQRESHRYTCRNDCSLEPNKKNVSISY